ncbi:MAG TPA: type II secretion system secretin GspD [Xanthobacteraceae bacterium]|nr:type II secretion system secretin GspD [Xanthobacteraceae bacterium]
MLRRVCPGGIRWLVLAAAGVVLAACLLHDPSDEAKPNDVRAQSVTDQVRAVDLSPKTPFPTNDGGIGNPPPSAAAVYLGDTTAPVRAATDAGADAGSDGYDLNFENAPVTTVAKVILGDILGTGYTIDPRVQGTITLSSGRAVSRADVLFVLENALRMSNVTMVRDRGGYRLIPAADATGSGFVDTDETTRAGYGVSVVPLRYVSAQAMLKLLDGFGVKPNAVRVDNTRNLVIIQGTGPERRSAVETILSFDGDWMRGQSVGVFPIHNSTPEPIITEIEKIMDTGEGGLSQNLIKFQPVSRLNAILVVSRKPEYLKTVATWIKRLDESDTSGVNLKVYRLRYGSAKQVAALLNEILVGRGSGGLDNAQSQVAPGAGLSVASSGGPLAALSAQPPTPLGQAGGAGGTGAAAAARPAGGAAGTAGNDQSAAGGGGSAFGARSGDAAQANIRITPDVTNNSILVYASQETQHIVEQTLRQIDRPLMQVAIDATVAEVTLNDALTYGVQYFLNSRNPGSQNAVSVTSTIAAAAGPLGGVFPGLNFVLGPASMPNVVLDALHSVTDVKVLSNPSLVVLDNQAATLQVGDQVPISTGTATVLTANNTVVSTIDYRNTGIILRVVPRISANGNVIIDVEQESSSVAPGSTGSLTPTISDRRVKSSISVASGQTVLLAGLISDETDRTRQGIPVLDKIPGIGDLFSQQGSTKIRTELIIFIRPTVIRDAVDAHMVAEELRSKLNGDQVGGNFPGLHNGPVLRP